ncbi:hepatitis A virus cellular receptor 1 homolog [Tiliqua scincoides]|uniref:hepatitis A virus cellular receptor 1 homolog n=1 Tax=Tiliqua scincoides TaxID=71010 RepID=UPI0034633429
MFLCSYPEWILVMVFTGSLASCSEIVVQGVVGQNITLPCHYDARRGTTTMCWGRDSCPTFQCSSVLIWTNGQQVTERQSSKYQLMGYIGQGNVSLTIVNVTEKDGGIYCCRVEIHGWNNDLKNNIKVVIETGTSSPTTDGMPIAITQSTESGFSLEPRWTSRSESPASQAKNTSLFSTKLLKEPRKTERTRTGVYIGIGIFAVLLVTVTPLILTWHLRKKQKMAHSTSQVAFSNSEIGGIQGPRIYAEENIYEMN